MKTLLLKDLRENFKLGAIGLLVFAGLLFYAYHVNLVALARLIDWRSASQINFLQPLLANNVLWLAGVFSGLFGALLGWTQTRNEAHRDLWAYLVHRPVTRTDIFWGKALAGLILYTVAAGVPLVVLVAVVRTPGQVAAPFEWLMALPVFELFLAGIGAYFAGLLMGLRQARWYASRGLGLGLVLIGFVQVLACPLWWEPLLGLAVVNGLLGLAVWGAYQNGGVYEGQNAAGKVALIAAMTSGCAVVMGLLLTVLDFMFVSPVSVIDHYTRYEMTRDGTIYKVTTHGSKTMGIVDLAGHPPKDSKTGKPMDEKEYRTLVAFGPNINWIHTDFSVNNPLRAGRSFFSLWNITDKTLWYLDRHGRLLGYDGVTRKFAGALEPSNSAGAATGEAFLQSNDNRYYYNAYNDPPRKFLSTARTIYRVDFKARTLEPLLTLTNETVRGFDEQQQNIGFDEVTTCFFATDKAVYFLDRLGHEIFRLPVAKNPDNQTGISLSELNPTGGAANRFAVWFYPGNQYDADASAKGSIEVDWIGPAGTGVTKTLDLPPLPVVYAANSSPWTEKLGEINCPPIIPLVTVGVQIYQHKPLHYDPRQGTWLAVICAVTGLWLARRYRFTTGAAMGWTTFILLLGLPGLLAFGCVQEWPAREVCGSCRKRRMVDRENCEHCGAGFPPPEKNGTEIFEALPSRVKMAE